MRVVYNACIRAEQTNTARPGIQKGIVSTFRPFQFNALHINSNRMCFIVPRRTEQNTKQVNNKKNAEQISVAKDGQLHLILKRWRF